jgi:hypothetical protein
MQWEILRSAGSLDMKLQFPHLEFAIFKGSSNSAAKNALNQCTSESTRSRASRLDRHNLRWHWKLHAELPECFHNNFT